jgi:uncharacterized membrane protein YkgB
MIISISIMYLWFGSLKFFPNLSPADQLAKATIHLLTFGFIPDKISILLLAAWEVAIGLMLIFNFRIRSAITLAFIHLAFTFTPFILLPTVSYRENLLELTLAGQYIIKNLAILSALLFIYPEKQKNQQAGTFKANPQVNLKAREVEAA